MDGVIHCVLTRTPRDRPSRQPSSARLRRGSLPWPKHRSRNNCPVSIADHPSNGGRNNFPDFGHHAACQRGAMFSTSRRPPPRSLRPPRCLPAWSHVPHQPSASSTLPLATTLLASVEPCSAPADAPPRDLFGHHAACRRGAMFKASRRPAHCVHRLEHRSTLASSVVAKQPISCRYLVLNTAPRWQAAWWRSSRFRADIWS